ncbi:MAG: hypothetical protein WBQ94_27985 [Terracidiphilus sp.]
MKRFVNVLTMMACLGLYMHAQRIFLDTPDAYLGQSPPSDTPKIFAPGLLTDGGTFVMGRVAFSREGKEFYYTQNDSWESGEHAQLKMIRCVDHHWGKPEVIAQQFLSPTLSMDGRVLYMRRANMHNVWESLRNGGGWSAPTEFMSPTYGVYDYMPTMSGNAYVGSDPDPEDVKNGITYAFSLLTVSNNQVTVKSLGRPLNEPGFNGDLYIAPDESYMIVSANETPTYQSELFISFRKPNLTWTAPITLGPKINNGLAHRWGQYVTPDGKYLFYSHGTSEKDCAIYWVRFDKLLETLRPRHF